MLEPVKSSESVDPIENGDFVIADYLRPFVPEGVPRDDGEQLLRDMLRKKDHVRTTAARGYGELHAAGATSDDRPAWIASVA